MAKKSHKKKTALQQRRVALIVAIGVLVLIIAGAMWWYFAPKNNQPSKPKDEFSREHQLDEMAQEADQKAQSAGVNEGAKIYDEAINDTSDQLEKSQLMASKATLYLNDGKNDQALALALEAEKLHSSSEISALIAQIYEMKKNNSKAVVYYKKAATQVDTKQPQGISDKEYFEAKAKELGGAR
jgi:flagellar basal body-associated protein FliL